MESSSTSRATDEADALGRTAFLGRAAHEGDRSAFTELFERIMPALYAWTELRTRRGSGIESQDVVQEVWMRAFQGLASYDPSLSFRGWIIGIAKNVLLQQLERRQRALATSRSTDSSLALGHDIPDSVTSVSLRFAKDDALQRFLAWVAELPPEERALILYCGIEGYTSAQAGERLGISAEATSKRWQTLRARIRQNVAVGSLAASILDS
jgi:RNA polymerase sigma-70 factor (ECF subfamily)